MLNPIIAILSDLHFGSNNHNYETFSQQMRFFEEQFFPYLLENDIKHVVHCGDFFHNRNIISWLLYTELKQRFFKWFDDNGVKFHTVLGNHDLFYKSTLEVNSLTETVKEFNNIIVYDSDTILTIEKYTIGMIPWIIDTKKHKFPTNCDILFAHLELNDFPMTKGITSKDGYNHTIFSKYKYVFSGHYHINFNRDNVYMVGTPYQLNWNDFNENKGFYVLNDTYELEYIHNIVNAKFVKLYYNDGELYQIGLNQFKEVTIQEAVGLAKFNYVRLFVEKVSNQLDLEQFHTSLQTISCNNYKIDIVNLIDVINDEMLESEFDSDEDTIDIIISTIEGMTFDECIDKSLLLELAKTIYKEATDESISL